MVETKQLVTVLFLSIFPISPRNILAETIVLKSGNAMEAKIIERTDKDIKINFQGTAVTYFFDEIESIDGKKNFSSSKESKKESTDNVDKNKLTEEVLELSGARQQIDNMPSLIEPQLEQYKAKQKPEVYELLSKIMKESYKAETIYRVVSNNLLSNFDQNRISNILNWYHSPLAQKITQLEVRAFSPEALQEMRQFATNLESNPPQEARINLIQNLDSVVGATDLNIELISTMGIQMLKVLQMTVPEDQRFKEQNWEDKFKSQMKSQLEPTMEQNSIISYLYTYRSLSDEDLGQYVNFFNTDDGQWLVKILNQGYLDAMAKIGREMGSKLGDAISQMKNISHI